MDNQLFFYDLPFNGQSHCTDDNGNVAYTATLYPIGIEQGHNLTVEQYKAENPSTQYSPLMTWGELLPIIEQYERATYIDQPPNVIDAERWGDMLNVLPPCRWSTKDYGLESFYVSEAMTGTIHSWFVTDGTKYVEFLDHRNATGARLADRFISAIESSA